MQATLRRMREERENGDRGFTMIELLVVVVIIGVLVAIAIPMYLNYRKGADNKSAQSDVRGAISAVEQYYTDNGNTYPATKVGTKGTALVFDSATAPQTAPVSPSNTLSFKNNTSTYVICGESASGGGIFVYNSATGGSAAKSTQTTLANCVSNGN